MAATKIDYSVPLTPEQAEFAAENHNLIYGFLRKHKLPIDDYYGTAALGLVRAVQAYSQSEELRQYKFSTLAYMQMRSILADERRNTRRHNIEALSLDAVVGQTGNSIGQLFVDHDTARDFKRILDTTELRDLLQGLTLEEKTILYLAAAEGIKHGAIGKMVGRHQVTVSRWLRRMKADIREKAVI
jgi:RNA polymerase sigma factor (sigma-70 family)